MAITIEKGVMMTVFVGLIAFGAMLLYNLVDVSGGFSIINRWLSNVFRDRFVLFFDDQLGVFCISAGHRRLWPAGGHRHDDFDEVRLPRGKSGSALYWATPGQSALVPWVLRSLPLIW